MQRSPLAPERFPTLAEVPGVRLAGVAAGVKRRGKLDLFLAELARGTAVAAVLTQSRTASAPVDWCRSLRPSGRGQAIIVNAGNANAFTGRVGAEHARRMAEVTAAQLGCRTRHVWVASTGVIGEPLPADRITAAVPKVVDSLAPGNWGSAARAIMTTDTFPKGATAVTQIGSKTVTISGIAKGSGMIAPDMATMLAFVFTDAKIPVPVLNDLLRRTTDRSFNCITVDSDTSTSDTLLLAATGRAGNRSPGATNDAQLRPFAAALQGVLTDLATQVVRDGEGASKFITIDVSGARSRRAARRVGLAIANSPLVKTAIAGEDANWGRIVMAVGKSGEQADRDLLRIAMGGVDIAMRGQRVGEYDESLVTEHLRGTEVHIGVDLGIGRGRARVWTCDLTHDYIRINAEYRS